MLGGLALVASCTSDFESVNTNKNNVATIGPAELPLLFSKAESAAPSSQWNYQVAQNLFADQYAQYFACEATYFGSDRLVINQNWVGAAFNPMYTDVVPQLKSIFDATDPNSSEYALASIWWVYTFHRVTDYWGPIPYFQAGIAAPSVPYDPQDKIYDDFFSRLKTAVEVLKSKGADDVPFGSYDIIYNGNKAKWIKFANTLRLRLALRISKVDPGRAKTEAEEAVASGVFTTSAADMGATASDRAASDDALVSRSLKGDDGNGLAIMQWDEFRMSASMESVLKGYEDPRMTEYFVPSKNDGSYQGLRNGLTSAQLTDKGGLNDHDYNSQQGPRWSPPDRGGIDGYLATPQNVMCTAEAYFLRAEGALNGWDMGGDAKSLYEAGIKNSMAQWGIKDDPSKNIDIAAYVVSTKTPIPPQDFLNSPAMTNIPVLFGATEAIQREQIATQKWLALFPDGMEAWADYRRSHLVKLYPVANSDNPLITDPSTQWLRRIPFLISETQSNAEAVDAAKSLLNGADNTQTPLWWDKN